MRHLVTIFFAIALSAYAGAQQIALSLEEAVAFAILNHPEVQKADLDIDMANQKVRETAAIGMPQVGATFGFQNNVELPVFMFPNPATGEQTAFRVGQKYSNALGITASQLIFDGQYFLGLKAASRYVALSEKSKELSLRDVKLGVTEAYYLLLLSDVQLNLLNQNIQTLEENLRQTKVLQQEGYAEQLDVDRLRLSVSNLNNSKEQLQAQRKASERLLLFQMGMTDLKHQIVLKDSLTNLFSGIESKLTSIKFDAGQRQEYQLLQAQQTLNLLDKKRIQVSRYPSIGAFYSYQQNNFSDELSFDPWFRSQLWGINLKVPVFTSGSTRSVIQQKEIQIQKTDVDIKQFTMAASMEYQNALERFDTRKSQLETTEQNLDLAKSILENALIKFNAGVGSNLEVISAQQELKQAQSNYLSTVYEVLMAFTEIQKASGQL